MKYIVAVLMFVGLVARADIVFTPVTWDAGTEGWTSRDGVGTVANSGSGALEMSFAGAGSPTAQTDAMVADNLAGFNGNYGAYRWLYVTFNWRGYASSAQSLYLETSFGGGSSWAYDFAVPDSNWHSYTISLNNDTGWTRLSGGGTFADALSDVTMIGIQVGHVNTGSAFDYQLDDWTYAIPEPASVAMVLMVIGSTATIIRKKRKLEICTEESASV